MRGRALHLLSKFRRVTSFLMLGFALVLPCAVYAAEAFQEGVHYQQLPISVAPSQTDTVEVVEIFSYACIHCYSFDPTLEEWVAEATKQDVSFRRLPAVFNKTWELLAQVYYTAEALQVIEKVHTPIFVAMHEQNLDPNDTQRLARIFAEYADVSEKDFNAALNSFSVRAKVQQAQGQGRAYRVTGVPSLVVAGKYRTDGRMAGNNTRMLQVVDFLVAREQQAAQVSAAE